MNFLDRSKECLDAGDLRKAFNAAEQVVWSGNVASLRDVRPVIVEIERRASTSDRRLARKCHDRIARVDGLLADAALSEERARERERAKAAFLSVPPPPETRPTPDGSQAHGFDSQLVALVNAAEHSLPCPWVVVFAGAQQFSGLPAGSSAFVDGSWSVLLPVYERALRQSHSTDDPRELLEGTLEGMRAFNTQGPDTPPTALTITDALWYLPGGAVWRYPVLRIPLAAIDAWAITDRTEVAAPPIQGSDGFIGLAVPVNFGG